MTGDGLSSPVDLSYLQEYTDGDTEMIASLLDVFRETVSESLEVLKSAIQDPSMASWKSAAHKLKGAAGYVGATHMKALCDTAQNMDEGTLEEKKARFNEILYSYERVTLFLKERKL